MMQARPYVIDRIDGKALTELEFIERFEKQNMPAIFTHLMDDWPAYQAVYCSVILGVTGWCKQYTFFLETSKEWIRKYLWVARTLVQHKRFFLRKIIKCQMFKSEKS